MTTHFEYLDEWFSKSAFGNTNLKRERKDMQGIDNPEKLGII